MLKVPVGCESPPVVVWCFLLLLSTVRSRLQHALTSEQSWCRAFSLDHIHQIDRRDRDESFSSSANGTQPANSASTAVPTEVCIFDEVMMGVWYIPSFFVHSPTTLDTSLQKRCTGIEIPAFRRSTRHQLRCVHRTR